jgi:hypothetical protein
MKSALFRYERRIVRTARPSKLEALASYLGVPVRILAFSTALLLFPLGLTAQTIEFDAGVAHRVVVTTQTHKILIPGASDSSVVARLDTVTTKQVSENGAGLFKSSGVELMSTAMQASAQVLKLEIGEGRLVIPLYFHMGAAGSAFKSGAPRAALASVLNPLAGNFNLNSANTRTLWRAGTNTVLRVNYNIGVKQFTSADTTGTGVPLVLGTVEGGLRFETRALLNQESAGTAYLQLVGGAIQGTDHANLVKLLGSDVKRRFGTLTVDGGIEITDILLSKFSVYQVVNGTNLRALKKPVFKFGFDYKPKA